MEAAWVIAAFSLGWLVSRIGFPPLVGYLLAGVGLAVAGHKSGPIVDELATVGVLLLLFTVGLKLRWQSLVKWEVVGVGGLHLAVFFALLFFGVFNVAGWPTRVEFVAAGALAFSSTVLAVKLLEARSEVGTFHGRLAIGILILQDIAAMALLASLGAKSPSPWALLLLLSLFARPLIGWIADRSGHSELLLLLGVGLALGLAAGAKAAGISPELGALLAGCLLAGHGQAQEMSKTMWGLKEFFLVAFFLKIGLWGLPDLGGWAWTAVFLGLLPLKAALFFGLFLLFRLRARTSFVVAVGLSNYSEFALIVAASAVSAGAIPASLVPALAMTVLISLVISAPLNKHVHTLYDRWEPLLERLQAKGRHPDDEPTQVGRAEWIICGMGRTGAAAYKMLEDEGRRVVGLDADHVKIAGQRTKKRRVVYGDIEDPDLWEHLHLENVQGVLFTLPDFEAKLRATQALRQRGYGGIIGATTLHLEEDPPLLAAGCTFIFHPFAAAGQKLAETALALKSAGDLS